MAAGFTQSTFVGDRKELATRERTLSECQTRRLLRLRLRDDDGRVESSVSPSSDFSFSVVLTLECSSSSSCVEEDRTWLGVVLLESTRGRVTEECGLFDLTDPTDPLAFSTKLRTLLLILPLSP